jgi:hypothetical protein
MAIPKHLILEYANTDIINQFPANGEGQIAGQGYKLL